MDDKDINCDDECGGVDCEMELSEEDRTRSMLNEERKIEEDLKEVEKEDIEDSEERVEWDGSEAERIADTDAEEYEENTTGIRITYKLEKEEIYKYLKRSKTYKKNVSLQVKHSIIQGILIFLMLLISIVMKNHVFGYIALVPIMSVIGIWVFPEISMKKLSKDMSKDRNVSIEIFPDVIDVNVNGLKSKILLDGKCEYEEFDDMIVLSPQKGASLIIPVRSIEPEFIPDVQAMIVSGTLPKNQD